MVDPAAGAEVAPDTNVARPAAADGCRVSLALPTAIIATRTDPDTDFSMIPAARYTDTTR